MRTIISPSILSADFKHLEQDIKKVEDAGADWLHFDVMDGHFVPNISFGIPVLKSISKCHHLVNDVHIMISDPMSYAPKFIEAGAEYLTFHLEACKDDHEVHEVIHLIHERGARAGLSIKPNTPVEDVYKFLNHLDMVLIMSVEPGFGGQTFMPEALEKIASLRQVIDQRGLNCLIEVDGGIDEVTGQQCKDAGVDVLVAGSYLFLADNVKERIEGLKK